jgi:peptide-methionine (S)-S-oxide reductase
MKWDSRGERMVWRMKHSLGKATAVSLAVLIWAAGCGQQSARSIDPNSKKEKELTKTMDEKSGTAGLKMATLGAGCFWCVEAVFQRLKGVEKVVSGYSGGHVDDPSYALVCTGSSGYAEVCQITYNPQIISYEELLEVFWKTHDPTTLNRQGNDIGTQYRSAIFYHDENQKNLAEAYKAKLEAESIWNRPITTEIVPFEKFWPAEDYHQNYYNNNPGKGYCSLVITPKLDKFTRVFKERLKHTN